MAGLVNIGKIIRPSEGNAWRTPGNLLANPTMTGFVPGVVGSGGIIPSPWFASGPSAVVTVVGVGAVAQGPYADIQIAGTGNGSTFVVVSWSANSGPAAVPGVAGRTFRSRFWVAAIAGDRSTFTVNQHKIVANDATPTFVGQTAVGLNIGPAPTLNDTTWTVTPATTAFVVPLFNEIPPVGPYSITYRIVNPSLVRIA